MGFQHYTQKFTWEEVLDLIDRGVYRVDLKTGLVFSNRTGREVFGFQSSRRSQVFTIRLYEVPKFISIARSRLVWMVGTRSPIPDGFEVHHRDRNSQNDAFINLLCLHKVDHDKEHGKNGYHHNGEF